MGYRVYHWPSVSDLLGCCTEFDTEKAIGGETSDSSTTQAKDIPSRPRKIRCFLITMVVFVVFLCYYYAYERVAFQKVSLTFKMTLYDPLSIM